MYIQIDLSLSTSISTYIPTHYLSPIQNSAWHTVGTTEVKVIIILMVFVIEAVPAIEPRAQGWNKKTIYRVK